MRVAVHYNTPIGQLQLQSHTGPKWPPIKLLGLSQLYPPITTTFHPHTGPKWPPIKLLGPSNVATVPPTSRFEFFLNHFSCNGFPSQRNFKLNVKKKELFNSFDCAQTNCFFFWGIIQWFFIFLKILRLPLFKFYIFPVHCNMYKCFWKVPCAALPNSRRIFQILHSRACCCK